MAQSTGDATIGRPALTENDILWITAGLGCDGDTIAITAATNPSLEDIVLGGVPGILKVKFHNPVLGYQTGDDFVAFFHAAAQGKIDPFILVVEGSIPNETINQEGYWAMNRIGDDRMANNQ